MTQSDTTAPVPQSLELSDTDIDLSNGNASITATTRLIDDLSGIGNKNSRNAEIRWRSPSGNQFIDASFFAYASGNDNDAVFENSYPITFNANAETGTWTIEYFYTTDEASNDKWYSPEELIKLGISTTINVSSETPSDTTAPVPQSLELSDTDIDLSNGNVSITATTRLIDDLSGIGNKNSRNAEIRWRSPSGNQFIDASFFAYTSGNDNDAVFENSYPITFNANAETGIWTIEYFYTTDEAGNSKWYRSEELIKLGIQDTFQVNRKPVQTIINSRSTLKSVKSLNRISTRGKISAFKLAEPVSIRSQTIETLIAGTKGRDKIIGTPKGEILAGQKGRDILRGRGGPDGFFFNSPQGFGTKRADIIKDFNSSEGDSILLDRSTFQLGKKNEVRLKIAKNKRSLNRLSRQRHSFIYDNRRGFLYFNENGKGRGWGDGGLFAKLQNAPEIVAPNFTIL